MKRLTAILLSLAALLALAACGAKEAPAAEAAPLPTAAVMPVVTAQPDPAPPAAPPATERADSPAETASGAGRAPEVVRLASPTPAPTATPVPTSTPEPVPTSTPAPTPVPLRPGTYTGSDGSVLTVKSDGTSTYETELSGTVNGRQMSGRVTFHGTVEEGVFSFTRVTYFGLDLTEIARSAGYSDASYWEQAAAILYADGADR